MARILLDWLNDEVVLSQTIYSLDDDFRDGYLLGELLSKYNQQADFDKFQNKNNSDAKINNFVLLEPTMRQIGIIFSSKTAVDIMKGKNGVSKKLLYEMRTSLERISKSSQPLPQNLSKANLDKSNQSSPSQSQTLENINNTASKSKILRVINPSRLLYDKTKSTTFENTIRSSIDNPNDVLMNQVVSKFRDKKTEFRESIDMGHSSMIGSMQLELTRQHDINRQRKQHESEFMEAWNMINKEQWKKNQLIARERRLLVKKLEDQDLNRTATRISNERTNAREKTLSSINSFDLRLKTEVFREDDNMKQTIGMSLKKTAGGAPGTGIPEVSYIDYSYLEAGLEIAQKKSKEKVEDYVVKQQTQDRRRRKFIRERESIVSSVLQNSAESEIVMQLLNPCKAEIFELQDATRVNIQKTVFVENKAYRTQLINKMDEVNTERLLEMNRMQSNQEISWNVDTLMLSQDNRLLNCNNTDFASNRQNSTETAVETINSILDIVDWVLSCRDVGLYNIKVSSEGEENDNKEELCLPESLLKDSKTMFSSHLPISKALPFSVESNISSQLPFSLSERPTRVNIDWITNKPFHSHHALPGGDVDEKSVVQYLAVNDVDKYIKYIAEFDIADGDNKLITLNSDEETPSIPNFKSTPSWLFNLPTKNVFGEILIDIRTSASPLPEDPTSKFSIPAFNSRVALSGLSNIARSTIAAAILEESKGKIVIIKVEVLLHNAIENSIISSVKNEEDRNEYDMFSIYLCEKVNKGEIIIDEDYISLIMIEIQKLPSNTGFVIQDFLYTKNQASLLIHAFSGIDYTSHKPQRLDNLSPYAIPFPCEKVVYDSSKCGLDKIYFVDNKDSVNNALSERVKSRIDLHTGETVYIDDSLLSMSGLEELHTPLRSIHTMIIELSTTDSGVNDLISFLNTLELAEVVNLSDYESLDDAAKKTAEKIVNLASLSVNQEEIIEDKVEEIINEEECEDKESVDVQNEEELNKVSEIIEPIEIVLGDITEKAACIPQILADALTGIWNENENTVVDIGRSFYASLRDIRYQMLQRRRVVFDIMQSIFMRRDVRQNLFEDFRVDFNSLEQDFRFDPDCIEELHLRTAELGDSLWEICDNRKKEAENFLEKVKLDAVINLSIHRTQCEGSSLLQAEFSRFIAILHILFDATKSFVGFDYLNRYANVLEETLAVTIPSIESGGDAKDSKGKPAAKDAKKGASGPVPYRDPVTPILFDPITLTKIPEVKTPEPAEVLDAKGKPVKGKGKDKGEDDNVVLNPFTVIEAATKDILKNWTKESFTVNRALYEDQENLCVIIENTVWHEAERFLNNLVVITNEVESQTKWLNNMETPLIKILENRIQERYVTETMTLDRLLSMIGKCIETSEPIRDEWITAADAISVLSSRIITPEPILPLVPVIKEYYCDHLNEEQLLMSKNWINLMNLGENLLVEDIYYMMDVIFSGVGPNGFISFSLNNNLLSSFKVPKDWRNDDMKIKTLETLAPKVKVHGINENVGTVNSVLIFEKMKRISSNVLNKDYENWVESV
jgi:hypothetical protein